MATISLDTSVDVVTKQRELVTEALGADGIYTRMKDTLEELLQDGEIKGTDRARIVGETIANMSASITANAMSTALQWAAQEKDVVLKKAELESKLDLMALEAQKLEQDAIASAANKHLLQAKILREYGVPTYDTNDDLAMLSDAGKIYEEIRALQQDTSNKALLPEQIQAQTDEVQARTHKLVADTYVNHGLFTGYTVSANGIAAATKVATGFVTLSELQKQVAKEQAKGYAWNAWSNAASASAGMLGTLVAAEIPELVDDATAALAKWSSVVTKLDAVEPPVISI